MIPLRFFVGLGICLIFQGWAGAQTLSLGRLIERAIESHPSIRSQLSNEKSAQLGIETAQYQRYPVGASCRRRCLERIESQRGRYRQEWATVSGFRKGTGAG